MLQIRLSKGSSSDGGGGGGGVKPLPVETVTVACPDHLVIADLPVAKCLGTANAASLVKSVGRKSRRQLGERVHFCVRCDFPIAIYGRLSPCEHVFCLDCARSDSSCYLCDERIQKIQTIKMMEGIFICAAPHCLKSFLKKFEFESHIHESHADLLQPNTEKEDGNDLDSFNVIRPSSSTDLHAKQSTPADSSTARAPPRPAFSPNSNPQPQDDKSRRHQFREQPPLKPLMHPKPPPFYGRHQNHPSDPQLDNSLPQGFDRPGPYGRFLPQNFDVQSGPHYRRDTDQFPDRQQGVIPESPYPDYSPMQSIQPPNFVVPMNANQGPTPPLFSYPPFPAEGAQPFYTAHYEMARPDLASEGGPEQGSLLGFPPAPAGSGNFPDNYPRPWNVGPAAAAPFETPPGGPGIPDGFSNPVHSLQAIMDGPWEVFLLILRCLQWATKTLNIRRVVVLQITRMERVCWHLSHCHSRHHLRHLTRHSSNGGGSRIQVMQVGRDRTMGGRMRSVMASEVARTSERSSNLLVKNTSLPLHSLFLSL